MESNLANAYNEAYRIACGRLSLCNPANIALNSGALFDATRSTLTIKYINKLCLVNSNTGDVSYADGNNGEVPSTVKVLILHYLLHATASPLSGNPISFREIPGGCGIYYSTFYKRAINPLLKTFSGKFELLYSAAGVLGGRKDSYGHASVSINIFPMVPVSYVLWQGDEEVESAAGILFDSSIAGFLPGEDIVLAASYGVYELMAAARNTEEL